jgi:hypothetical protein
MARSITGVIVTRRGTGTRRLPVDQPDKQSQETYQLFRQAETGAGSLKLGRKL